MSITTFPYSEFYFASLQMWIGVIHLACRGLIDLNAALWSRLPIKIVERVLSFLPVLDLCRYCIVCKTWNQLIRAPEFGAQCAKNAAKSDASFIVIRSYRVAESPEPPAINSDYTG